MTTGSKEFHIGDVLSITSGRLVSLDHVGGVYKILNWMTGEDLMTHQLPRAARECEAFLIGQHPELASVNIPQIANMEDLNVFLTSLYPRFGEMVSVEVLPHDSHTHIDPITEIMMMRPDIMLLLVKTGEGECKGGDGA